jgi:hypothetical protein
MKRIYSFILVVFACACVCVCVVVAVTAVNSLHRSPSVSVSTENPDYGGGINHNCDRRIAPEPMPVKEYISPLAGE